MSSESGQRLSMEELQRLNPPPHPVPPIIQAAQFQAAQKAKRDWEELLAALTALHRLERINSDRLERLEASVSAQEALLRALTRQVGQLPTQVQLEALTRDVAQIRETLQQAGRKREISISPPSLETALSVLIWLILILLGTMVGMVVLQTIWSGLAALWSAVRILIP